MNSFRIQILVTGGTLAKRYEVRTGQLEVDNSVVDALVSRLRLPDMDVRIRHVLARDSLDMTDSERSEIPVAVREIANDVDAAVVIHGTDTMSTTARLLVTELPDLGIPVVLTGAMVPYRNADSDAIQNVAQAIMACRLLPPGIHIVFHGRALDGSRAIKDYDMMTFVLSDD